MLNLSACGMPFLGGYGANGLSKEEFTHYVENVFRLQNSLTSQAMMLMEGDDNNNRYASLLLAEHKMHKACQYLNEYASKDNEGANISILLQRNVEKTAVDCEQAANAFAEQLAEQPE
ncbi:MAG: hypothetical protein ABL925_01430 [Methylococcales bacterium]